MLNLRTKKRLFLAIFFTAIIIAIGSTVPQSNSTDASPASPVQAQTDITAELQTLPSPNLSLPPIPDKAVPIYAKSYMLIDTQTKYPLLAKQEDTRVPIASTTKIMTTLVALETMPLDKVVTVSREAATIPGSEIQLLTGEKMTVKNLLYALLISSANDAAYALANADGEVADFVQKMNAKAKTLGLQNTEYRDPAGLDDAGYSTPRDLAVLTSHALNSELFRTIIGTPTYTIWSADNRYKHELTNSNRLVNPEEALYLPQAIGGKTGFTFEAGHCLVAAAKFGDNKEYVAVVLNTVEASKEASAREVRKLLTWVGIQ